MTKFLARLISFLPLVYSETIGDTFQDIVGTNIESTNPGVTEENDFRRTFKALNMVAIRLCQSAPTECDGFTLSQVTTNIWLSLRNYGCNCFPTEADQANRYPAEENFDEWNYAFFGKPVDELDALCALNYRRFNCFDAAIGDTIPRENAHAGRDCYRNIVHVYHVDANTEELLCGGTWNPSYANGGDEKACQREACKIELEFANEAWRFFDPSQGGVSHHEFKSFHAANYNLNSQGLCQRNALGPVDQQCCGEFPNRISYNANSMCCDDGEINQCLTP